MLDFDFVFKENVFDQEKYEQMNEIINDGGTPTKYFTIDELKAVQIKAYKRFIIYRSLSYLINPLKLAAKIRSGEDFKYVTRVGIQGLKILSKSFTKTDTKALLRD